MDTIIKNGTIVTETDTYRADIGISDGRIVTISENIQDTNCNNIIDAKNKIIMPGGIDIHVHLQLPFCGTVSKDDFENGTKAAACGGITTVIDYAIQEKGKQVMDAVIKRQKEADGNVCVDYSLHAGITDWDIASEEINDLIKSGITSFKMFMVYKDMGWMADDGDLIQALETTVNTGTMLMVHAENDFAISMLSKRVRPKASELGAYADIISRPNYTEHEAISRAILWAEVTGGRLFIVHMSTAEGTEAVFNARKKGINVFAETCPHYLTLNNSILKGPDGHLYTPSPPLREERDIERLWKGIEEITVDSIGTDTCTFDTQQKGLWKGDFKKLPFGLPGLETAIPIMHTYGVLKNRINMNRLVQLCSSNPAKIFGLYPQKGTINIGSDADITIFDPEKEKIINCNELQTNCDWSPYEGFKLKGFPVLTLCRGRVVSREGKFVGETGYGKFIKRKTAKCQKVTDNKAVSIPSLA